MQTEQIRRVRDHLGDAIVPARVAGRRHEGDHPPVVLLHGLGMSSRYFERMLRRLGTDRYVLAPDPPEQPHSPGKRLSLNTEQHADLLRRWIEQRGFERVVLVGHSVGCQSAGLLAAHHPDRVTHVVLASPARDPHTRNLAVYVLRLLIGGLREDLTLIPIATVDYLRAGPIRMLKVLREATRNDPTPVISAIEQPTLVLRGEHDLVTSDEWAHTLAAALSRGRFQGIPGGAHGLPWGSSGPLSAAVRQFTDARR